MMKGFLVAFLALADGFMQPRLRRPLTRRSAAESPAEVKFADVDGTNVRVGIIKTRWNEPVITGLRDGIIKTLGEAGVQDANIFETEVGHPLSAKMCRC